MNKVDFLYLFVLYVIQKGGCHKETHRPKSFYVREAIERSLDDIEDIYLTQSRLEALRAGQSKTFTLEEVEKELGLENPI